MPVGSPLAAHMPQSPETESFVSIGSAADLCKMAMIRIFSAVATSPTLTARSVRMVGPPVCQPFPGLGREVAVLCKTPKPAPPEGSPFWPRSHHRAKDPLSLSPSSS